MPHPHPATDLKPWFSPAHTFAEAYAFVGTGATFLSTTGESIKAIQGTTKDHATKIIVFRGERNRHGATCETCWGYGLACDKAWIGQCAKPLDEIIVSSTAL